MAVTPLFGVPMDGGAQSFDGVDPSRSDQFTPPTPPGITGSHHSGFQNVLGFLGDFLMSRLHMGTPYHDSRENEKLNAARLADEQSGDTTYARTGALNPAWAAQLQNRAIDNNRLAASVASTTEFRDARLADQKEKLAKDVFLRASGYFNSMDPKDPKFLEHYKNGRALWLNSATVKNNPDLAQHLSDMFPEQYDPYMVHSSIASNVTPAKQWDQAITENRDANNVALGTERIKTTQRGQDISHGDRQDSIAHADGRAAARNATSASNTAARIAAKGPPKTPAAKPTGEMISYLRAHPEKRDSFDGKFGVGMAKRILGN